MVDLYLRLKLKIIEKAQIQRYMCLLDTLCQSTPSESVYKIITRAENIKKMYPRFVP